jgi:hypothetical protein
MRKLAIAAAVVFMSSVACSHPGGGTATTTASQTPSATQTAAAPTTSPTPLVSTGDQIAIAAEAKRFILAEFELPPTAQFSDIPNDCGQPENPANAACRDGTFWAPNIVRIEFHAPFLDVYAAAVPRRPALGPRRRRP